MIEFKQGDIFKSGADGLCNPVNTRGVMGKGLALQFKKLFPEYFKEYSQRCNFSALQGGDVLAYTARWGGKNIFIFSCFTKEDWRQPSRLEWVQQCLKEIPRRMLVHCVKTVAVPPLGCGLGGLDWGVVRQNMVETFSQYPNFKFLIYEPTDEKRLHNEAVPGLRSNERTQVRQSL